VEAISDLPKPDDIDADYSPQYVKLARILRAEIEAGKHARGVLLPAVVLAREHRVSAHVALGALAMLAANGYVARRSANGPYRVTWEPAGSGEEAGR